MASLIQSAIAEILMNISNICVMLLPAELDKLLKDAPLPFIMQHTARIFSVRKRITSLNSLLKSIRERQRVEREAETKRVNDMKR
ncbi:hypothetical protein RND71_006195 [Anisodus tanguticus]|uniref:Uncharacterized protein n=1 Tax=Anisodus tanguticus TaxID=243964 RepID=A0AAE1VM77_9SOLA|nr:hypothetical protein RND71_006195 [Anisodus tanguticus]